MTSTTKRERDARPERGSAKTKAAADKPEPKAGARARKSKPGRVVHLAEDPGWALRLWVLRVAAILTLGGACALGARLLTAHRLPAFTGWEEGEVPDGDGLRKGNLSNAGGLGNGAVPTETFLRLVKLLLRFEKEGPLGKGPVLQEIRDAQDVYEPILLELIDEERRDLMVPAILVVGRLHVIGAEHRLFDLARTDEGAAIRAASVTALGYYKFWTRSLLAQRFDKEEASEVLIAALEVASRMHNRPVRRIMKLLLHEDELVRKTAVNALPRNLAAADLDRLVSLISAADSDRAVSAITAFGALDATPARDAALLQWLGSDDWRVRRSCLQALATGDTRLNDIGPVWRSVQRPDAGTEEQVFAFVVFEFRDAVDLDRIHAVIDRLHPVVRYHAARCLITMGDRDGVEVLLQLLETRIGPGVDDEDQLCARREARNVLMEISGRDEGFVRDSWEPWYRELGELEPRELDTRPRTSW